MSQKSLERTSERFADSTGWAHRTLIWFSIRHAFEQGYKMRLRDDERQEERVERELVAER